LRSSATDTLRYEPWTIAAARVPAVLVGDPLAKTLVCRHAELDDLCPAQRAA
jgi:hypothetical protein